MIFNLDCPFRRGNFVVPKEEHPQLNSYFNGEVGEVIKVSKVNLQYEKYFITVKINNGEQVFYSKALRKI